MSRRALVAAVRQLNVVGPASRVLAAGPQVPADAVSCFDFFRFRVRALTPSVGHDPFGDTHGFWDRTLLQTAHVEPAVWHAVAALGALQRKWEIVSRLSQVSPATPEAGSTGSEDMVGQVVGAFDDDDDTTKEMESRSVQLAGHASTSYIRALKMANSMTDINATLVLSIALAAAANLTGKWVDSRVHIRAATKLVGQLADEARGKPVAELCINDAADSLARLDLQWLTFQDSQAPYPYLESQLSAHALRRAPEFKSLSHAQDLLMGIMRKIWITAGLAGTEQPGSDDTNQGGIDIVADFAEWEYKTIRLLGNTTMSAKEASPSLLFLKICHATVHLVILAGITTSDHNELFWDDQLAHFERIIALSALFIQAEVYKNPLLPSVVSLDGPGIIMTLWLIAFRCRHPLIRRRALGLLRVARRQEGMWMSTSAAVVAQKIIEIEEAGSRGEAWVSDMTMVPAFCTLEPITAFEQELVKQFQVEDLDPQSWLLGSGLWTARTKWEVPATTLIPLERRITEVSTFAQPYDPRKGRSKADVALFFADRDLNGHMRKEVISVSF